MFRIRFAYVPLLVLSLITCAAHRPGLSMPDLVQEAEAIANSDRTAAIAMLEDHLAQGSNTDIAPWAMLWAGEQRRLSGNPTVARAWFETLAERHPTHPLKDGALLGMALVDAEKAVSGNLIATLELLPKQNIPQTMNADRYRILARVAADDGANQRQVDEYIRLAMDNASTDASVLLRVKNTLGDLLVKDDEIEEAPAAQDIEPLSPDMVTLNKAHDALETEDFAGAIALATMLVETFPDSPLAPDAQALIKLAEAGAPFQQGHVGVLLPMSGQYAPVGTRLRQVIELGNESVGSPMTLHFYDTGADEANAVTGLESLILENGCSAVLGPLLKENVMEAAKSAQSFGIPMIALSQAKKPTEAGPFVFRGFLPLEQQIDAIVQHAHETEGLTRFAIIHPANSYGETARDLFAIALERRSLPVVRIVSYDPAATDFRTAAQELGQKDYKEARKEEYRKMIRDAERENLDTDKIMLPPIVEFDALFVPDNHQRVPLVASALAYEEFPVGTFHPYRDAVPITLLGLNGWNNPKLVEAGGQYMINGLFVDAFLPSHSDEGVQAFVSTYQEMFERSPSVIDAVTYDTVRILGKAIATGADTRGLVRDAVKTTIIEGPAANGDHFGEDREMARDLLVLTISEEEGIVEWQAPEEEIPETEITTP